MRPSSSAAKYETLSLSGNKKVDYIQNLGMDAIKSGSQTGRVSLHNLGGAVEHFNQ